MAWRVDIHRWDNALTRLGQLTNAHGLTVTAGLNRVGSAAFQIDYSNPLANTLLEEACVVVIYKRMRDTSWHPIFAGPVEAIDEAASDGIPTIAIACVGAGIRLSRLIADDGSGAGFTPNGLTFSGVDKSSYLRQLVTWGNARGNTWLRVDAAASSSADVTIDSEEGVGGFQSVAELMNQFTSAGDCEWLTYFQAPADDGSGQVLAKFVSGGLLGSDRTGDDGYRFEYGLGSKNVKAISVKSEAQMANTVYHVAAGETPYAVSSENLVHRIQYGRLEEVAPCELTDSGLRKQWTDAVVSVRRAPKRFYDLELMPEHEASVPQWISDYNLGDRVRLRGQWGTRLIDVAVRIYDIQTSLDDAGNETVQLGLVAG